MPKRSTDLRIVPLLGGGRWHTERLLLQPAKMPELPDITVYVECIAQRAQGAELSDVRVLNPFLLRTAVPALESVRGRRLLGVQRLGKRVVFVLEGGLHLVLHLMIAGRLRWLARGAKPAGKSTLAIFEFDTGTLVLTEAGSKRRASLHVLPDGAALIAMDPGGIDVLSADAQEFAARLVAENHTLKRALTNPRLLSGIGNAYSDEILHSARLSPVALTRTLDELGRMFNVTRERIRQVEHQSLQKLASMEIGRAHV